MTTAGVGWMIGADLIGVVLVMLWVWAPPIGRKRTEAELRTAARWTLTIPLWMWVVWPGLIGVLVLVLGDKVHDLCLMAKDPPRMPEPPSEKGSPPTADELRAIVATHDAETVPDDMPQARAAGVEDAHDHRGALLDLLRALAQPIPYRPGLPTVEQVRAHEARGGWWQWMPAPEGLPFPPWQPQVRMHRVNADAGLSTFDLNSPLVCRPCLPDGTPCAWPDEPDPWAVLDVLR